MGPESQKHEQLKFGTKEFFVDYISNQIKSEGKVQEVVARIHFALSQLIIETQKGRDAFEMLKNLTAACEQLSEWKKTISYVS
jgi:hypothetical protein